MIAARTTYVSAQRQLRDRERRKGYCAEQLGDPPDRTKAHPIVAGKLIAPDGAKAHWRASQRVRVTRQIAPNLLDRCQRVPLVVFAPLIINDIFDLTCDGLALVRLFVRVGVTAGEEVVRKGHCVLLGSQIGGVIAAHCLHLPSAPGLVVATRYFFLVHSWKLPPTPQEKPAQRSG
jgi:hypothetical protein